MLRILVDRYPNSARYCCWSKRASAIHCKECSRRVHRCADTSRWINCN